MYSPYQSLIEKDHKHSVYVLTDCWLFAYGTTEADNTSLNCQSGQLLLSHLAGGKTGRLKRS